MEQNDAILSIACALSCATEELVRQRMARVKNKGVLLATSSEYADALQAVKTFAWALDLAQDTE